MSDTLEKIYCTGQDNTALISALANKQSDPLATAAMMNGGMNNWNNNPFVYLVWMMMMRYMNGNGWDNNGENYNSRQIAALQDTVNTNHNNDLAMQAIQGNTSAIADLATNMNTSFANVQQAVCGVRSAIENVSGQVGYSAEKVINAANLGDLNIIQNLKDCCCNTQKAILTQGYEAQLATERQTGILGSKIDNNHAADMLQDSQYQSQTMSRIDQLANGVQQGFAQLGYQSNTDKCDILNAITASQQKTNDLLTTHWQAETSQALQDAKNEISQLKQTQYLSNLIGGGCACNGSINLQ